MSGREEKKKRSLHFYSRQNVFFSSSNSNNDITLLIEVVKKEEKKGITVIYIYTLCLYTYFVLITEYLSVIELAFLFKLEQQCKEKLQLFSNRQEKAGYKSIKLFLVVLFVVHSFKSIYLVKMHDK